MKWEDYRSSDNVEDRRGEGGGGFGGGMGLPIPFGGGGMGIGTIIIVGLIMWALGVDPRIIVGNMDDIVQQPPSGQQTRIPSGPGPGGKAGPPQDQLGRFVSSTLAQTEDVWRKVFPEQVGRRYQEPRLVIFSGGIRSACGGASAAMGPFYCPLDQRVYLDLSFFNDLRTRFGAPGDFAAAYVIAHEVGHHIENLLGILPKVQQQQQQSGRAQANQLSVRVELMADCLAGVWAHHANSQLKTLQPGDIEKAITAAGAIGDDTISGGRMRPESFTHGSSAQRVQWFTTGVKSGQIKSCNTFN